VSKQRKEALAAIMDGLDILVGMDKPEEKKEVEREKAPDSFTGLLQSLIPLMIIPQILPLFQQSLGQTLRDTTVNVKVESATSIIPIDITATTAIVPIEIRASQVTLNVNIQSQTTVLNVNIAGSVTLDVNVVGDAMVVIKAQQVGLYLGDTWGAILGQHVDLVGFSWLDPFSEQLVVQFYPNPGEQYLIEGISVSYILPKDTNVRPNLIVFRVYTGELTIIDNLVASLNVTREKPTDFINLMRAIPVSSDEPLKIVAISYSPMRVGVQTTVYLYRV